MQTRTFTTAGVFQGALLGGVASGAIDIGLYFVGRAVGATYLAPGPPPQPLPWFMSMVNSVMSALVASVVLVVLAKLVPARAWTVFLGVSAVMFLLWGLLPPMAIPGDTLGIVTLEVMHVVTAAGILGGIWRWGRIVAP